MPLFLAFFVVPRLQLRRKRPAFSAVERNTVTALPAAGIFCSKPKGGLITLLREVYRFPI